MSGSAHDTERPSLARRLAVNIPVALLIVAAIGLKLGIVQSLRVSSVNMSPTLSPDDHVMVRSYGAAPTRGDVVVYRSPFDPDHLQVGRIVAMDGDRIELTEEGLLLNGEPVAAAPASSCGDSDLCSIPSALSTACAAENAPADPSAAAACESDRWLIASEKVGAHTYYTRRAGGLQSLLFSSQVVPAGHVFVLSDNRVDERDSRIYGPIPRDVIVGVASFVYYAFDETGIRWDRMNRRVS